MNHRSIHFKSGAFRLFWCALITLLLVAGLTVAVSAAPADSVRTLAGGRAEMTALFVVLAVILIFAILLLTFLFILGRKARKAARNIENAAEVAPSDEPLPKETPAEEAPVVAKPASGVRPQKWAGGTPALVLPFAKFATAIDPTEEYEDEEAFQEESAEPVAEVFSKIDSESEFEIEIEIDPEPATPHRLVYIDTKKNPERYREMLASEAAGKTQIFYRYRRSCQANLSQADDKIQDYYSAIKNAMLGYRGVHARKSWTCETFNRGRMPIAKIVPKNKTLCLYLAIDPAELEETKYNVSDASEKKKFEETPLLLKIRGDRKFKFALELIEKLCGETLALKPNQKPEADYKIPRMTDKKLLEAGLIKKLAAEAPLHASAPTYGRKSDED